MGGKIKVKAGDLIADRFEVIETLGSGTQAFVVRALDRETGEHVACRIPLVFGSLEDDPMLTHYNQLRRFRSTSLVSVLGLFRHRGHDQQYRFIALEWVAGVEFSVWRKDQPIRDRIRALREIGETLRQLGQDGNAHGDLTPSNVLVSHSGRVVLIDPDSESFGTSTTRRDNTQDAKLDRRAYLDLVRESFTQVESNALQFFLNRLENAETTKITIGDVVTGLDDLKARRSLPGETAQENSSAIARSVITRRMEYREIFLRLAKQRDLIFANLVDQITSDVSVFECELRRKPHDASEGGQLRREVESPVPGRGRLEHRLATWVSPAGDELLLSFEGKSDFRLPWREPTTPGLVDRGWLNVLRDGNAIAQVRLALYEINGNLVVLVDEHDRERPVAGEIDRVIRILNEVVWPGISEPTRSDSVAAYDAPNIRHEHIFPALDEHGIARPSSKCGWLSACVNLGLRVRPGELKHNPQLGSGLPQFFCVQGDYGQRLALVTASIPMKSYFGPLYKFDVSVVDEATGRLRVELEGRLYDGTEVQWSYEVELPC